MSSAPREMLAAVALQLAGALQAYEQDLRLLGAVDWDPELETRIEGRMEAMGQQCALLPQLARPWIFFLIGHSHVMYALCKLRVGEPAARDLQERVAEQHALAATLRQRLRLLHL